MKSQWEILFVGIGIWVFMQILILFLDWIGKKILFHIRWKYQCDSSNEAGTYSIYHSRYGKGIHFVMKGEK